MSTEGARIARLREFFAQDRGNVALACDLSDALASQGDVAGASQVLAELPDPQAQQPGVGFRRARLSLVTGDYGRAREGYEQLIAAGVDAAAVRHDLAFARLCQRDAEGALGIASEAAQAFGDSPELAILRARCSLMLEDFDGARQHIETAIELDASRADVHGVAALVHLDAGDNAAALAASTRALAVAPDQHEALMVAGTLALWSQRADDAGLLFERALERFPNSGRVLSGLGQVHMLRNDLPKAQGVLEHAVTAMPDHIGTWHALAWCQLLQGRVDEAEAAYRSAYDLDRNFGDTHGGLALVAALRGQIDEADHLAKVALRLDPNAMTARYAQTLVLDARGERSDADRLMEELLAADGAVNALPAREFAERLRATITSTSR